ncbi:tRNA uridine-5-carboxymethylaminomethyl(34) synthesis GTPase MnmE, partial [Phocaeicola paurosaccharolyticus]|uniref:tRNA uridine-5-carboxymethylaminomethyl(34) synthesis GTPase MnmE n=1 Tax=Phocaeicola paurosaccharolyticus TaxID=732242 RepID=UPI00046B05FD
MTNQDTICAIATAQGGAIGTIRVSGPNAVEITSSIFKPIKGKGLLDRKPYTLTFGNITNKGGDIVDEVLVSLFRAPHSYTGEDSTEIMCHGSSYILQQVMQLLIQNGCRSANAGEFTQRAFLNGKMDLSQAEAVADLVASSSAASHKLAMSQMRGGFSKELTLLRDKLLHITSLMELELDFSDHEDLEFADRNDLKELAANIETVITRLAKSFSVGNVIKNGIPVAIIGETNVGKSTLLNALLNEEKAIVSDIHGTTRDVIEDTMNIGGVTFRFIDTAGIRQTTDKIENIGIERTFQKLSQADIVLWMIDTTDKADGFEKIKKEILPHCVDKKLIILFNKSDLLSASQQDEIQNYFNDVDAEKIFISAKTKQNIEKLEEILVKASALPQINQGDVIVTNIRHYEALTHALESIHRVQEGMSMNLSGDLVSEDLRQCIFHLSDIVGEVTTDQVLENIFKNF